MIDRSARDKVICAIDGFLNDGIDAFEFDDRLFEIASDDKTVGYAVHVLWFHYDDCTNHKAVLSKEEWDFIQRIKLVLNSDEEITVRSERRWAWDHALAWICFAVFLVLAISLGWGWHLLTLAVPFGFISMWISRYRESHPIEFHPNINLLHPFSSFSQLRTLRERFPSFTKQRYRLELGECRIRSKLTEGVGVIHGIVLLVLLGPVALFFQGFSTTARETVIITRP